MCLCLQSLVPQEFSVVMGRTASVNFEIYQQDNSMEVKIINIQSVKKDIQSETQNIMLVLWKRVFHITMITAT